MKNHLASCPRLVTEVGCITAPETLECSSDDSTWINLSIVKRLKAKKYFGISRAEWMKDSLRMFIDPESLVFNVCLRTSCSRTSKMTEFELRTLPAF
ncbi:hypothetical protein JG688_00008083 [Phytophthora aleatoria]|uniref:Uncharacterized protein n=1 Tax=Phytophthora aleatoria TaxID=2496075 RepID=A0A8J5ITK0_9STRA|nr:hypothetical protein JG688_00008083 [Phytophthora aleatoria]